MNTAPVSVVVPCYRCTLTIERAIASVAAQTVRPAEVILVEDASGDGTLEVLQAIGARYVGWVKIVACETNRGAASARNLGWSLASQDYIAFLDADDTWHPCKIETQCAYMLNHPEVALSGHLCRQLAQEAAGAPLWSISLQGVEPITWRKLLVRHAFVTPSVMLKRSIAFRFAEGQRHMEDHRLWMEIVGAALPTVKLHAELAAVYKPVYGASGLSADMWGMERAELANYRYFYDLGRISAPLLLVLLAYSLLKYLRRLLIVRFLLSTR